LLWVEGLVFVYQLEEPKVELKGSEKAMVMALSTVRVCLNMLAKRKVKGLDEPREKLSKDQVKGIS
jgi:hypothetical protein